MARRFLVIALILSVTSGTMLTGCSGLGGLGALLGGGGSGGIMSILAIPLQIIVPLLLEALLSGLTGSSNTSGNGVA
jgi:hypothetical protein